MPKLYKEGDYVVLKEGASNDNWVTGRNLIGARGVIAATPSSEKLTCIVDPYMTYRGYCERMLLYTDEINLLWECPYAKQI